jgi:hypothetical protein
MDISEANLETETELLKEIGITEMEIGLPVTGNENGELETNTTLHKTDTSLDYSGYKKRDLQQVEKKEQRWLNNNVSVPYARKEKHKRQLSQPNTDRLDSPSEGNLDGF